MTNAICPNAGWTRTADILPLVRQNFQTLLHAQKFLQEQVRLFELLFYTAIIEPKIHAGKKYAGPGLFCGFAVSIKGERFFVAAQSSDCCALIVNPSEHSFCTAEKGNGLSHRLEPRVPSLPRILSYRIWPGSKICLFSDGIGEYLTQHEILEEVKATNDGQRLFENLKAKINSQTSNIGRIQAASEEQRKLCRLVKDPSDLGDDLSLVLLQF